MWAASQGFLRGRLDDDAEFHGDQREGGGRTGGGVHVLRDTGPACERGHDPVVLLALPAPVGDSGEAPWVAAAPRRGCHIGR